VKRRRRRAFRGHGSSRFATPSPITATIPMASALLWGLSRSMILNCRLSDRARAVANSMICGVFRPQLCLRTFVATRRKHVLWRNDQTIRRRDDMA